MNVLQVGTSNMTAVRYIAQAIISLPFLLRKPEIIAEATRMEFGLIILSGFGIGIATLATFASLLMIPIVDTTVLLNAQPIIVLVISGIWLKERIRYLDILMVLLVVVGVIFVSQPTFIFGIPDVDGVQGLSMAWQGYLLAILACIGSALTLCILRKVRFSDMFYILFMQSLVVITCSLILGIIIKDTHDPVTLKDWVFLLGATLSDLISRACTTLSVQYEETNILVVVQTTEIIFSLMYQLIWFRIYPTSMGMVGVVTIVISVIIMSLKHKVYAALNALKDSVTSEKTRLIQY